MKKILICFILTLVSISGYSQWLEPKYHPADELTGEAAYYSNVYNETGVGMFIAWSNEPTVKLVTDRGIFDYENGRVTVLIGFYEGSTLVEKTTAKFWVPDGNSHRAYSPDDNLGKKILEYIKTKGKVRFIAPRYSGADFDLTVPMNKDLKWTNPKLISAKETAQQVATTILDE